MSISPLFDDLINAFRCLPGIGPRTASRMALFSLQNEPKKARLLAETLISAIEKIHPCMICGVPTETQPCKFCNDPKRDDSLICVISSPSEVLLIENSKLFFGRYHLLDGLLSPIDGRGSKEIGMPRLVDRLINGKFTEVLLALPSNIEGEATTHQILNSTPNSILVSRLAQGVPIGGEIENLNLTTLQHAFLSRTKVSK